MKTPSKHKIIFNKHFPDILYIQSFTPILMAISFFLLNYCLRSLAILFWLDCQTKWIVIWFVDYEKVFFLARPFQHRRKTQMCGCRRCIGWKGRPCRIYPKRNPWEVHLKWNSAAPTRAGQTIWQIIYINTNKKVHDSGEWPPKVIQKHNNGTRCGDLWRWSKGLRWGPRGKARW